MSVRTSEATGGIAQHRAAKPTLTVRDDHRHDHGETLMEETPNHKFNQYQHGERPWGHQEDFKEVEETLPIRDVESNLSEYTPHGGATFIATDTGAVYDGTGAEWVPAKRVFGDISTMGGSEATVWGSTGDHVLLGSHQIAPNSTLSTSSTSYISLTSPSQRPMIHTYRVGDLSNVTSKEICFICVLAAGSDSANAYARLNTFRVGSIPGTEISRSYASGAYVSSAWAPYETGLPDRIELEGRVNTASGTCSVHSATVYIAGVID